MMEKGLILIHAEILKLNNYPVDFRKCSAVVIVAKHFTKRLPEKNN